MKKPYSFNNRLKRISIIGFCIMILSGIISLFIGYVSYDSSVNLWITEHSGGKSINPIHPSLTSIPYYSILIDNFVLVLVLPIILIACSFFVIRKISKVLINSEINYLYNSIGIESKEKHSEGILKLSDDNMLSITQLSSGIFEIKYDEKIISFATGDELYWKKNYLEFIKNKVNNK